MANIKVAVRIRPVSTRELNLTGSEVVVHAEQNEISLTNLKVSSSKAGDSRERTRRYGFDYCFDSSDPEAENYADQEKIYETLGQSVLDALFSGYNSCLVAYGQTASGKTYTMMGTKDDPGLTPRLCHGLFSRIEEERKNDRIYRLSISYLEIYNERVRDLLKPSSGPGGLRVREHPRLGPYVQGLTRYVVHTLSSLMSYVEEGTRARKTASTLQNPSSSRSHALLTIAISEESLNVTNAVTSGDQSNSTVSSNLRRNETSPRSGSKLHLVDLAGSESAATCSGIHRLKEGANINKSLVALGNVISALAERGSTGSGPGRRFIPYRDSSLTWLLKDALGGNATTIMLATISPARGSYNETAHTLRFAQRAQSVVNRPVINEDPVAKIIRELRAEVARLKSLLLEKDIEPENRKSCTCKAEYSLETESKTIAQIEGDPEKELEEEEKEKKIPAIIRRSISSDSITATEIRSQREIRRFGSYECLALRKPVSYKRAKVTELTEEEDEISEINESVFVDIPTLVAVLIKPDDNLHETGAQIEEICSDEVPEDSIDTEFLDSGNVDQEEQSSSINSCHAIGDTDFGEAYSRNSTESVSRLSESLSSTKGSRKLHKQDSIDVVGSVVRSNLHTSKKFGSVEIIQRKKEPLLTLERSQTNLEKRAVLGDRGKKLNNIREIDDQKEKNRIGSLWLQGSGSIGSKEQLQRKGSNDSDKSLKDSGSGTKSKGYPRKPSIENLKRKTSKDSSSSSSKDEQILISSLTRDKLLRRKSSLEQEAPSGRTHTPIQRTKRAEIVAAVTERLYSSRKHVEEGTSSTSMSGIRSPPEGTDVKATNSVFATRSKLQELSRKMLAKRKRVCADTQTDILRTVRVKDTASLTELEYQDASVLTDNHEVCEFPQQRTPTIRVKEIATLTDKPKTSIVRYKDVGSLVNDLDELDYRISPLNDSGILSDDTQNYVDSNLSNRELSDLRMENEEKMISVENSTNTPRLSSCRNSAIQVPPQAAVGNELSSSKTPVCIRECCKLLEEAQESCPREISSVQTSSVQIPLREISNLQVPNVSVGNIQVANPEKNVISISLPDMVNITIESTNLLESRVAVMDSIDHMEEKVKIVTRDGEAQTEEYSKISVERENRLCFKDLTRSTLSQSEGRVFRIENIFHDPKNVAKSSSSKIDVASASQESGPMKNSFTFTNSLGTSYVTNAKESSSGFEMRRAEGIDPYCELSKSTSFVKDGLITEAFITKKRSISLTPAKSSQSFTQPWQNWSIYYPMNSVQCIDYGKENEIIPTSWQLENNQFLLNSLTLSCKNSAVPVAVEKNSELQSSSAGSDSNSINFENLINSTPSQVVIESNNLPDHDYNFSDDSLDFCVSNALSKKVILNTEGESAREVRDNLCPPDVVAQTKKIIEESSKASITDSDTDKVENVELNSTTVFEENNIEFPKLKPHSSESQSIHDYKSLILGEPSSGVQESEEISGNLSTGKNSGKKKVSFSSTSSERKRAESDECGGGLKGINGKSLKSIIKKNKINSVGSESMIQSSSDETDDSLQEKNNFSNSRRNTSDDVLTSETCNSSKVNRKNGKSMCEENSEETCSESDSYGTVEEDEEVLSKRWPRNILEEYLEEAVNFLRNMNSINEYTSNAKSFERNPGWGRKRGYRRRICTTRPEDYVEFQGRKISLKDDTDKYLEEEGNIVISTESYDRCLKGIQRLEDCIQRVDKQTELLREKYGINCKSAGARLSLASSSIDPTTSSVSNNETLTINTPTLISDRNDIQLSTYPQKSEEIHTSNKNFDRYTNCEKSEDDLERKIFQQLISAVDSVHCTNLRRLKLDRSSKSTNVFPRSNTSPRGFHSRTHLTHSSIEENDSLDEDDTWKSLDCSAKINSTSFHDKLTNGCSTSKVINSYPKKIPIERTHVTESKSTLERTNERLEESFGKHTEVISLKMNPLTGNELSDLEDSIDPVKGHLNTIDGVVNLRNKLRYPGSPRARFLELLRERRRIVESSRSSNTF